MDKAKGRNFLTITLNWCSVSVSQILKFWLVEPVLLKSGVFGNAPQFSLVVQLYHPNMFNSCWLPLISGTHAHSIPFRRAPVKKCWKQPWFASFPTNWAKPKIGECAVASVRCEVTHPASSWVRHVAQVVLCLVEKAQELRVVMGIQGGLGAWVFHKQRDFSTKDMVVRDPPTIWRWSMGPSKKMILGYFRDGIFFGVYQCKCGTQLTRPSCFVRMYSN